MNKTIVAGEFPEGSTIYPAATLDRVPKAIFMASPQYPFELRRGHVQGKVIVRFIIGPDGSVTSARAISSPDPLFSQAAEAAVRQWRFEPGEKNGRKVYTQTEVPITFSLD
jgi:protein TonB